MGQNPESNVPGGREGRWASRLVWGVLLVWLSPVILAVLVTGLVGVATSGSLGIAARWTTIRAGALLASHAGPVNPAG